jgi:hypothetical protein
MRPRERRDSGRAIFCARGWIRSSTCDIRLWRWRECGVGVSREDIRGGLHGRPRSTAAANTADGAGLIILKYTHDLSDEVLCERWVKNPKVYSPLHAPEVEYIGKGKAHFPYEFAVKESVTTTLKHDKGGNASPTPSRCRAKSL